MIESSSQKDIDPGPRDLMFRRHVAVLRRSNNTASISEAKHTSPRGAVQKCMIVHANHSPVAFEGGHQESDAARFLVQIPSEDA
jgi:hypothetical protein